MPTTQVAISLALLGVFGGCLIGRTTAHLEDYCIANASATGVQNFFSQAALDKCQYASYRPKCVADVLKVSAKTFAYASPCRGAIHFDAVYIVATALGLDAEMSYWLAAFSQGIDFVQFEAVDSCGQPMSPSLWTPPMRGLMRTSSQTAGSLRHLGVPYGTEKTSGLHPNLTDYEHEGALSQYRAWARDEVDLLCTYGITEPTTPNGSYFGGERCIGPGRWLVQHGSFIVAGPIPATYEPFELGDQVLLSTLPIRNTT